MAEDRRDEIAQCPTCGPTDTEQHPRRSDVTRCANCKEWLTDEIAQVGRSAAHRFNNETRYRTDDHEMQRQLTPGYVLEPVRQALGGIDLDPCTEPDNPCRAERFYTADTDGAEEPWDAQTIYCNPPYSKARERWVKRCIAAAAAGSRVVLLMPSHTDTRLFHLAVQTASHVVFIKGRVKFGVLRENRRQEAASHPSCLIAWNLVDAGPLAHLGAVWDSPYSPVQPEAGERRG